MLPVVARCWCVPANILCFENVRIDPRLDITGQKSVSGAKNRLQNRCSGAEETFKKHVECMFENVVASYDLVLRYFVCYLVLGYPILEGVLVSTLVAT